MLATCAFVAGVVETVLRWEEFGLRQLSRHGMPRLTPFRLRKHSSRRGWRILRDSLGVNPFAADVNAPLWKLRDGRMLSLRAIAAEIVTPFRQQIQRLSDATTLQHIVAVFAGDARSLLDFPKRPEAYDDAGRVIDWGRRRMRQWSPSSTQTAIPRGIPSAPIRIAHKRYSCN